MKNLNLSTCSQILTNMTNIEFYQKAKELFDYDPDTGTLIWAVRPARRVHIGYYDTAEDAHKAYCDAADLLHGEFKNYGKS